MREGKGGWRENRGEGEPGFPDPKSSGAALLLWFPAPGSPAISAPHQAAALKREEPSLLLHGSCQLSAQQNVLLFIFMPEYNTSEQIDMFKLAGMPSCLFFNIA